MARVRLIDGSQAPLLARPFYADGDPGPIVAALANVPELLEAAMPFIGAALGGSAVDERTKELVILRASADAACTYCTGTHTVVALDLGLSPAEVRALRGETPVGEVFAAPAERAVIAWTDAVVGGAAAELAAARDELARYHDDHDVVELTVVATTTLMLARLCTALDLPLSESNIRRLREAGIPLSLRP